MMRRLPTFKRKSLLAVEALGVLLLLIAVLTFALPQFMRAQRVRSFEGMVAKDQTFRKKIGANLQFELRPTEKGWNLWIIDPADPSLNLAGLATPPFHGINARQIRGWHFRNEANTGPNDGSINAPGKMRTFHYFDNLQSAQRAKRTFNRQDDVAFRNLVKANGTLRIEALQLNNTKKGQRSGIDSMQFHVALDW